MKMKTFKDLKKGEKFYIYNKVEKSLDIHKVSSVNYDSKSKRMEVDIIINEVEGFGLTLDIDEKGLNESTLSSNELIFSVNPIQ